MTLFARNLSAQAIWKYAHGKKRAYDLHERELVPRGVQIKAQILNRPRRYAWGVDWLITWKRLEAD